MSIVGSIVVFIVQNEPYLKTRIGSSNTYTLILAPIDGIVKIRMCISVKDGPYLVPLLKGIAILCLMFSL